MPSLRPFLEPYPYETNRGAIMPQPSDWIDVRVLGIATPERHAVPTGAQYVSFSATGDFYAKFGGNAVDAAVPSGDVTDGTGSELNPAGRRIVAGVTHISLAAPAATTVTMSFWS